MKMVDIGDLTREDFRKYNEDFERLNEQKDRAFRSALRLCKNHKEYIAYGRDANIFLTYKNQKALIELLALSLDEGLLREIIKKAVEKYREECKDELFLQDIFIK